MSFDDDIKFAEWKARKFDSREAEQAAFDDPRYKTSADWRAAVAAKVAISDNGIEPKSYNDTREVRVGSGGIGASKTEAGVQVTEDLKSVDEQMREQYGAMSVAPPPKVPKVASPHVSQFANAESIRMTVEKFPEQ